MQLAIVTPNDKADAHAEAPAAAPAAAPLERQPTVQEMVSSIAPPIYRAWWIIDPRTSKGMQYWEVVTSTALIFTALLTPYEVAFVPPAREVVEPWFIVNRIVDGIFLGLRVSSART